MDLLCLCGINLTSLCRYWLCRYSSSEYKKKLSRKQMVQKLKNAGNIGSHVGEDGLLDHDLLCDTPRYTPVSYL